MSLADDIQFVPRGNVPGLEERRKRTSKLSMRNNPVARRKRRYWLLEKRKRNLSALARPGSIEYEDGVAARFYPNTHSRRRKAEQLRARIRSEQNQIADWLRGHGYTLA